MSNKKDLASQLRDLTSENKRLKRELAKYRKYSNKFADIVMESWGDTDTPNRKPEDKLAICDECGKGETRKISILGMCFVVCQLCKSRKKVT